MFRPGGRRVFRDDAMSVRSAIALVAAPLACFALTGCGGSGSAASGDRPAAIPHQLGLQLVGRTSAIEASLKSGDECAALEQGTKLQQAEADAIAAGKIPVELRAELVDSTQALIAQIRCTPPKPPAHHHHTHDKKHGDGGGD
jgi:hypothetical protein